MATFWDRASPLARAELSEYANETTREGAGLASEWRIPEDETIGTRRGSIMWKAGIILAATAAAALFCVSAASAHPGAWYWSRAVAENYIIDSVNSSDGESIVDVTCSGMGRPLRRSGRILWHHLRCDENDDLQREFTVTFHPTSRYHAAVIEVTCDDTYSEYPCP